MTKCDHLVATSYKTSLLRAAMQDDHHALRIFHAKWPDIRMDVTPVFRCTVLHLVLQGVRPPLDTVSLLIKSNPEMGMMANAEGNLPLHVACYQTQCAEILRVLVDSCPWALAVPNKKGHDPLTAACGSGASLDVVRLLSEARCPPRVDGLLWRLLESSVTGKGSGTMLRAEPPASLLRLLDSYVNLRERWDEKYQSRPTTKTEDDNDDTNGSGVETTRRWFTPLHGACGSAAPRDVISYLSDRHPSFLTTQDAENGDTPLHVAFSHDASPDVKQELIDRRPDALRATNKKGLAPFECCTVTMLLRFVWSIQQEEHFLLRDRDGNTLAHLVFMYNATHTLKRKVVEEAPLALTIRNRRCLTPLGCSSVSDLYCFVRNNPDLFKA